MKNILHKIAHILHWNYGKPDSFYQDDILLMSFKCSGCGERSGIHPIDQIIDQEINKKQ